jgi:hypothetical protein
MKLTANRKIWVGSVGFVLCGAIMIFAAGTYPGRYPRWVQFLEAALFVISAVLWLVGSRESKKSVQH